MNDEVEQPTRGRRHWLCWLVGHQVNGRGDLYYGHWCRRCVENKGVPWWALPFYAAKVAIKEPFAKCEDCGKRFFRHDETVDHVPF